MVDQERRREAQQRLDRQERNLSLPGGDITTTLQAAELRPRRSEIDVQVVGQLGHEPTVAIFGAGDGGQERRSSGVARDCTCDRLMP